MVERKHIRPCVILAAAVLAALAPLQAFGQVILSPGDLVGVNSGSGGYFLTKINKATGAISIIGNTGITIDGLAFSPNGELFAADNANHRLVTLNRTTGAVDRIIGPYGGSQTVEGLAFRPSDGTLFAVDLSTASLATLDLTTGALTPIGGFGVTPLAGLTFSGDGSVLYGLYHTDGELYTIDTLTGAATLVGGTGGGSSGGPLGMATDPATGLLYAAEWRAGADMTLATVNPLTGARTQVGTMTGALQIEGLTFFPIPEPPAAALVVTGLLIAAIRQRRRRLMDAS